MSTKSNRFADVTISREEKIYIDKETGEEVPAEQIIKRVFGKQHFWKLYLSDYLHILDLSLDNKQLDVLIHILRNTNSDNNIFIGTYKAIADGAGVSMDTVQRIMTKLLYNGFLTRVQNGLYRIDARLMMKGGDAKRAMLIRYSDEERAANNSSMEESD